MKLRNVLLLFFVLFSVFFSFHSTVNASISITNGGFTTTSGTPICTPSNTSGCAAFQNAGRQGDTPFQGTLVSQGNMLLGVKSYSSSGYQFYTGTIIGNNIGTVNLTGAISSSPGGSNPVRASYLCSGVGFGTNVPLSAQIASDGTWTVPLPTGGSDISCTMTLEYATEPDFIPPPASPGSGYTCTGVCGTTLSISNPGSRTAQRGQTALYSITVGQSGLIWATNIDITCPANSDCQLLNSLGEVLSNCQFDSLTPGGGGCNIYTPDYTGRFPASYFSSGGATYQLLVTPLNPIADGNQNILIQAKTASQRRLDPSDSSSTIVNDCSGICIVSTTAQLTVLPPLTPPVVTLTGNPASGSSPLTTTLSWSATNNPLSCTASGSWTGNKTAPTGSEVMSGLTSSKAYTLTCTNSAGSGSATANIGVSSATGSCTPGATRSFGVGCTGTETCTAGGAWPGTASYSTGPYASNGTSCNVNSCMTGQSCSAGMCTGGTAITTGSCAVGGGGACTTPLTTATANGYSATGGASLPYQSQVTVSWSPVPGATSYRVKIWDTGVTGNNQSFGPQTTYAVDITTTGTSVVVPYGSASSFTKQFLGTIDTTGCTSGLLINYRVAPPSSGTPPPTPPPSGGGPLPTVNLTANPNPVAYATRPNLQWTITNATSCFDNYGNMPGGGNWQTGQNGSGLPVAIFSSENYKLTCYGPGGSASHEITVGVDPSTVPASGKCGNADGKTYPYTTDVYGTDLQCAPGNVTDDPGFPNPGQTFYWRCNTGPTFVGAGSQNCSASRAPASSVCSLPNLRPSPTITAPASAAVNSQFEVRCDYGDARDYIPAPAGCVWPGSNGGHVGSAATFTCSAGGVPTTKSYFCQSQNNPDPQFTKWCSVPNPTPTKNVTITGNPPTVVLEIIPDPIPSNPPTVTWTTGNNPTTCTATSNPSLSSWNGSKVATGGSAPLSGLTQQTSLTLTCSNAGGSGTDTIIVIPNTNLQFSVTVFKTQGGSVTSNDGGISCGTSCQKLYDEGTVVRLVPTPESGRYKFVGWSGACLGMGSGSTNTCILTVDSAKNVTANFAPKSLIYEEF